MRWACGVSEPSNRARNSSSLSLRASGARGAIASSGHRGSQATQAPGYAGRQAGHAPFVASSCPAAIAKLYRRRSLRRIGTRGVVGGTAGAAGSTERADSLR